MDTKLEKFVAEVGGCGQFQVFLSVAVYTIKIVASWSMMFMTFGTYNPGWTCEGPSENNTDVISGKGKTRNVTALSGTTSASTSIVYNLSSYEENVCQGLQSCSDIRFEPESSTIVTEWDLICDRQWLGSLTISIQMVGVTIGSLVTGQMAERFGRKSIMYLWVGLGVLLNGLAVFSVSWEMYVVFRFFIGITVGGNLSTSQVYALEFVTGKWRMFLTGLPTWNLGSLLFGICVFILKDWRHVHITATVVSFLAFLTVFWVPESLRWLAVHGKVKETRQVAQKICRQNGRPEPDPSAIDFTSCEGGKEDKNATFRQLFVPSLRKKTIVGCAIYFLMAVMYYSIGFGIKSLYGDFYINFILFSAMAIPVAPLAPILGHKLGRRWGSAVLMCVAGLISFAVVVVNFTASGSTRGHVITGLALAISILLDHSWSILIAFLAELFPTSVRLLGFSFVFTAARLGSIVSPFLIPRDFSILYVSYVVMGILAAICCLLILSLPETKDLGLEDTLQVATVLKEETAVDEDSKPLREKRV
ncbi:solute carrier family 22 member 5 [Aplysia californica]|uniref:Solute carrier family 22 member 5 n=1 Tax=Aplysia californica TaxID=6500 RepID=A0ABM0JQ83_APLCA|nr:solute carrier family 22 member 5 [Aplysia californica]